MKNIAQTIYTAAGQLDANKVRLIVFVLTMVMFAVAAGAPEASGGIVR
ncbi:MAG TPA: hypothetical protein VF806_05935 [Anaerolineaceae bacterium]